MVRIDNIGDIQAYIMATKPSWNVPEKRRLQKFVKRAISNQSPLSPSSQQSEVTSESTNNNEMDNRSERSRSSRFKGIANRLFGGNNNSSTSNTSPRKVKSETSQPPVREIHTTTTKAEVNTTEEFFTESVNTGVLLQDDGKVIGAPHVESTTDPIAVATVAVVAEMKDDRISSDDVPVVVATSRDAGLDEMYNDDNDGKISKRERCCFFMWFC